MSFRDAHKKSATLVNIAEKNNLTLDELDFLTIKKVEKSVEKDVLKIFDLKNSVNSKKSYGGTSPFNVNKMINKYQKELK
ncbi:MAG: argininosuccinate lyase, partial [Candidatus Fonsibacter ubiquis]|jgi:argininosuccinate lyase